MIRRYYEKVPGSYHIQHWNVGHLKRQIPTRPVTTCLKILNGPLSGLGLQWTTKMRIRIEQNEIQQMTKSDTACALGF